MAEYKITKVSEQPPREYEGQHGTIYYIKVALEGHERPVSIGKKSPDALKIGDTVHGTITETQYETDKFTADKLPPQSKGYQKSASDKEDIARAVALKAAVEIYVATVGEDLKGGFQAGPVLNTADEFLVWLKGAKPDTEPEKSSEDKPRDWGNLGKKKDVVIEDLGDEPINLDDIPF